MKLTCNYTYCKENEIKKGDSIKIFFICKHLYHTKCIENYKSKISLFNKDTNINVVDIENLELFEINFYEKNNFINSINENLGEFVECINCTENDIQ